MQESGERGKEREREGGSQSLLGGVDGGRVAKRWLGALAGVRKRKAFQADGVQSGQRLRAGGEGRGVGWKEGNREQP